MRHRLKKPACLGLALSLFLMAGLSRSWAEEAAPAASPAAQDTDEEALPAGTSFEAYERSVDDLFRVSLMTHPDPDFGVNSIIVNMNRQLAEKPDDANTLIALGHLYRLLGQPEEANRFYEKAIKASPDNFHLNVFSAKMFYQGDDLQQAVDRIEKALELNPNDASVWDVHGGLLLRLGREKEALMSFKKALELEPERPSALFAASVLYQRAGRDEEALKLLETLAVKHPEDLALKYQLGLLHFSQGRSKPALEVWEEVFVKGVRSPQFLFNLTLAYLETENVEKAENLLQHLRFLFPGELDIDFLFAEGYRRTGRLNEAVHKYEEIISLAPGYVSAYIGLAMAFEQLGNMDASQAAMEQARAAFASQQQTANQPEAGFPEDLQTALTEHLDA